MGNTNVDGQGGGTMLKYPVAQIFTSPQGEGRHSGRLMKFIRLAGCNVGRYKKGDTKELQDLRVIHPRHSICTSALGDSFLCDTDYHSVAQLTAHEILEYPRYLNALGGDLALYFLSVCLTGGEPLMYDLMELVQAIAAHGWKTHMETSGTKPIPGLFKDYPTWVTCSPKRDFLTSNRDMVDEWKFVVAANCDVAIAHGKILEIIGDTDKPVYIQPVNGVRTLDPLSVDKVLALQRLDPRFLVSQQLHKVLGVE